MRKKSGQERLKIAIGLRESVLKLAEEAIKNINPKISSGELRDKLRKEYMDLITILKIVVRRLEKLKIPYVLTGGLAVSFGGAPRTTHDIDIVIDACNEDKGKILDIFKKDFYISEIAVSQAIDQQFTFNIVHFKEGLKVDFWLSKKDSFKIAEFKRRLKKKIFGKEIYIISPEDLILEKLLWYKESGSSKHFEDVKSIIEISKPDLAYIKKWAGKQLTSKILEEILKERKRWLKLTT